MDPATIYTREEDFKCGGCNWESHVKYSVTKSQLKDEALCKDCILELLAEMGVIIIKIAEVE